jgi:hypothetical protein
VAQEGVYGIRIGFSHKNRNSSNVVSGFFTFSIICDERRRPDGRPCGGSITGTIFKKNTELPRHASEEPWGGEPSPKFHSFFAIFMIRVRTPVHARYHRAFFPALSCILQFFSSKRNIQEPSRSTKA